MRDLLPPGSGPDVVDAYSNYATSIFLIGWASGGLLLGVLGDRIGRVKTMLISILLYSLFTGLSSFSVSFNDFTLFRFLTGLGVGGEFAVGVALVAEVMPDRARPYALASLQALSAIGNVGAALIGMALGGLVHAGYLPNVWRPMFVIGAAPALLVLVIFRRLKEPETAGNTRAMKGLLPKNWVLTASCLAIHAGAGTHWLVWPWPLPGWSVCGRSPFTQWTF